MRVVQDDNSDFPASLCLVENVGDTCPFQFLPVAFIPYGNTVTNVALALSDLTDPTVSSLRPNSLVRRPSMVGVKAVANAANVGVANIPSGLMRSEGSWK
jgi:hypothetical protein